MYSNTIHSSMILHHVSCLIPMHVQSLHHCSYTMPWQTPHKAQSTQSVEGNKHILFSVIVAIAKTNTVSQFMAYSKDNPFSYGIFYEKNVTLWYTMFCLSRNCDGLSTDFVIILILQ